MKIRLYDAGTFHYVRSFDKLHSGPVWSLAILGYDHVLSASYDKTVSLTSLETAKPVAQVQVPFQVHSAEVVKGGRVAAVGNASNVGMKAMIFSPPAAAAQITRKYPEKGCGALQTPLYQALVDVLAGTLSPAAACASTINPAACAVRFKVLSTRTSLP
jgi:hypothetical protein